MSPPETERPHLFDAALKTSKPEIRRLVGTDGNFGEQIGLTKDWVVRIIRHVRNYAKPTIVTSA
jgi:hypothetical protein